VLSRNPAHGCGLQAWHPTDEAHGGLFTFRPTAEAVRPASVRPVAEAVWLAHTGRCGAHRVHGHRTRGPRGGVAGGGSPVDGTRQGSRCKHHRSAAKVRGKKMEAGLTLVVARCVGRRGGVSVEAVGVVTRENGPGERRGTDGRRGEAAGAVSERRRKSTARGGAFRLAAGTVAF
jgi:hypothetical protein